MSRIPIRNIYYLLLYAWKRLDAQDWIPVSAEDAPDLPDLLARVLIAATNRVLREGLDRSYIEHSDESRILRGQLDISVTLQRALPLRRLVYVHTDELSVDNLLNRIVKATARRLSRASNLDPKQQHALKDLCRRLSPISDIPLSRSDFRQAQVHSNNAFYRFLLSVCELAFDNLLPEEGEGDYRFQEFLRDAQQLGQLFETFVRNFLAMYLNGCKVESEWIRWDTEAGFLGSPLLPTMKTDVILRWPEETVVLDAKCYKNILTRHHGSERMQSEHLYQLYTYLKNLEKNQGPDHVATGVLLYAGTGQPLHETVPLRGHTVIVAAIDLAQPWREIHEYLLRLAHEAREACVARRTVSATTM